MSVKRILIVTSELVPFHYGGIGTQFKSLVAFLKRHGYRVSLLARKPVNYDAHIYMSHYGETPVFFVDAPPVQTGPPQHFVYAAEVARRFDEIYPEALPDLVIFADFNAEGLFLLLRSGYGAYQGTEFLLTTQGMNYEVISVREGNGRGTSASMMDLPDIRLLLAMEDLCVNLAPTIVSPTVCTWEEVRQRLGIDKPARVIPNLVDPGLFRPGESGPRETPLEPLILFVGRLDRMKGTDLLLKAYFEIADQMHPAIPRIIFIGRDCYWNEYDATFLEYWRSRIPEKVAGAITFLGQVSHESIRDYLQRASVAVFPSRWEPFGIVCLEALAMGCPVVVSKGTGLEEIIGLELSEFAVPVSEDTGPLAKKIQDVLNGNVFTSREKLQARFREVIRQAETGWLALLSEPVREEREEKTAVKPLCASFCQMLNSIGDLGGDTVHLQIYFCQNGDYAEKDSLRASYARNRWTNLELPMPSGTAERYLRLDPADAPGIIRIREIVLLDASGAEIWRADTANGFQGCKAGGSDFASIRDSCLSIEAATNDPQLFLDCPQTNQPVTMRITLCAGDN